MTSPLTSVPDFHSYRVSLRRSRERPPWETTCAKLVRLLPRGRSVGSLEACGALAGPPDGKRDRASCRSCAGGRRLCRAHKSWITGRPPPRSRRDFCNRGIAQARSGGSDARPTRKMSCPGWRVTRGGEGGRSSASNGVVGARGLRPRGRPIEEEVPTVVHGMRWAALRAAGGGVVARPWFSIGRWRGVDRDGA